VNQPRRVIGWLAALALAGCHVEGLEGASADAIVGAHPLAALPWGLPALVLGVIAGFYARPEGRTGARQSKTGTFTILALIFAGICARAMMGPRWQLGYGLLFGALAIGGLAAGRLWNPAQRRLAIGGSVGALGGLAVIALAIPTWSGATPYLALAAGVGLGAVGMFGASRLKPATST